jgi:hypothetical protein
MPDVDLDTVDVQTVVSLAGLVPPYPDGLPMDDDTAGALLDALAVRHSERIAGASERIARALERVADALEG